MTTTIPAGASVDGGRAGAELIDGDGHVFEDVTGVIDRLPGDYRELRLQEVSGRRGVSGTRLFPPLGSLSAMPYTAAAIARRGPEESGLDPSSWEYFLDKVGIDRTVLYPTIGLTVGHLRDHDYAVALTRAYNDWIAEVYVHHPSGKFQAAALLPMQVPEVAAAELRRAVTELGLCAGVVPSNGLPDHTGSERFFPVYEAAQELDVGLGFHGGDGHERLGMDDFNVYAAVHALGHPFSLLRSMAGMLFNNVFEMFPRLRIAYLEGGAAWTLLAAERFSESFRALVPVKSKRVLSLPPGTSVRDYITRLMQEDRLVFGCEGGEDYLASAIGYFGCTPFMFSSDFPHEVSATSCAHELEELDELDLAEEAKQALRGETARRFYRLP